MSNQFDLSEETAISYVKLDECLRSVRVQPVDDHNLSTVEEIPESQYVVEEDGIYLHEPLLGCRNVCSAKKITSKQSFVEAFEKYINNQ